MFQSHEGTRQTCGSVAILGHSFIFGLQSHFENRFKGHPNDLEHFIAEELAVSDHVQRLFLFGQRGATIESFDMPEMCLSHIHPAIIILDLGTNDLVYCDKLEWLAKDLVDLARFCRDRFQAIVGVCSIVRRTGSLGKIDSEEFDRRATGINEILREQLSYQENIFFHSHKGFWDKEISGQKYPLSVEEWSGDGIHPNLPGGRKKYKNSLRRAICKALKFL
jgi:hypothetical protein